MWIPPIAVVCFAVSLAGYGIDRTAMPEWGKSLCGLGAGLIILTACFVL